MGFKMAKKSPMSISGKLLADIAQSLKELGGWGSIEIYVQNNKVTQITKREIKKTNHLLESS